MISNKSVTTLVEWMRLELSVVKGPLGEEECVVCHKPISNDQIVVTLGHY